MYRAERILVGCILVTVAIPLSVVGYNKLQPTSIGKAVGLLEQLSGEQAPEELRSSKTAGYAFLFGGAVAFLGGLGFILSSRRLTSNPGTSKIGKE